MPKRLTHFLTILLLALSFARPAEAGISSWVAICAEHFKHFLVRNLTLPLTGKPLLGTFRETGKKVKLKVKKRLGYGNVGAVYDIDLTHADGTKEFGTVVGKSVHRYRVVGQIGYMKASLPLEVHLKDRLQAMLPALQKNELYPKDSAFPSTVLPLAPMLGTVKTKKGDILLKRKLIGKTVADFGRENLDKPSDFMPPEMEQSLKEIHGFIKAVETETAKTGKPMYLDLNPNNLMWVTDPALLAEIGFSRPSFVAFEMTEAGPGASAGDWASYRQLYLDFARHAGDSASP